MKEKQSSNSEKTNASTGQALPIKRVLCIATKILNNFPGCIEQVSLGIGLVADGNTVKLILKKSTLLWVSGRRTENQT